MKFWKEMKLYWLNTNKKVIAVIFIVFTIVSLSFVNYSNILNEHSISDGYSGLDKKAKHIFHDDNVNLYVGGWLIKRKCAGDLFELRKPSHVLKVNETENAGAYFPSINNIMDEISYISNIDVLKLISEYDAGSKEIGYVGSRSCTYYNQNDTTQYYNCLASFPGQAKGRMHGILGTFRNGSRLYVEAGNPRDKIDIFSDDVLKSGGGFSREMSDSISLDRVPADSRDALCKSITYELKGLPTASVIFTFHNEHLSTLLRSLHSVLNNTPPPILREIILVDDHSTFVDLLPGGFLYDYVKLLPKVKLFRMQKRSGIVRSRLAGIRHATGDVVVILDSHIEVAPTWLEPMLQRLLESHNSVVMPQIDSINASTFDFDSKAGIGCFVDFMYSVVELSSLTGAITNNNPIPSPAMAGGLFAIWRDYFWTLGGYDESFSFWGAENVEFSFRIWLCGGRLECTPCSRVYHIFRRKGVGYVNPPDELWRNRLRTARIWMDDFYKFALLFAPNQTLDIGNLDHMLTLKRQLNCKPFTWYLENVGTKIYLKEINSIKYAGEVRLLDNVFCIDTMSSNTIGSKLGTFYCHSQKGTQGYIMTHTDTKIRVMAKESFCIDKNLKLESCRHDTNVDGWKYDLATKQLIHSSSNRNDLCIKFVNPKELADSLNLVQCDNNDPFQRWIIEEYRDIHVEPLTWSFQKA